MEKDFDKPRIVVMPFFRGGVQIDRRVASLFLRKVKTKTFLRLLAKSHPIFRQNIRRVWTACESAHSLDAEVALFDGWTRNVAFPNRNGKVRRWTGSQTAYIIVRLLQRHGLTRYKGPVHRENTSRCTWEEIQALRSFAGNGRIHLLGVTDVPCPSAVRAKCYAQELKVNSMDVLTPIEALQYSGYHFDETSHSVWNSLKPQEREYWKGFIWELPNWCVHVVSWLSEPFYSKDVPLEVRIAKKLRKEPVE